MKKRYDWVERTLFILFSYAHITDWEVSSSERTLIQSKTEDIFKIIVGDLSKHPPDILEKKMTRAYNYWQKLEQISIDDVLAELQEVSTNIASQRWFTPDFANQLIGFLGEVAKADGVILDSEKFSLIDLANIWNVKPRL